MKKEISPEQSEKFNEIRKLVAEGVPVYMACNQVGVPISQWYTQNKKSGWRIANQVPFPKGQVMVIYLEAFFGKLDPRITIAHYDNPSDYSKPDQGKGWVDWHTNNKILVTHWAPLPALPQSLMNFSMDQVELISKVPDVKSQSFFGTINIEELL